MDEQFDGDWRALFGAPSNRLHSVFLGDPSAPDAGVVELVVVRGRARAGRRVASPAAVDAAPPVSGFFLLSVYVDVDEVLGRLAALGLGGEPRRITVPGPGGDVTMATVRDPDGVLVELIGPPPGGHVTDGH